MSLYHRVLNTMMELMSYVDDCRRELMSLNHRVLNAMIKLMYL